MLVHCGSEAVSNDLSNCCNGLKRLDYSFSIIFSPFVIIFNVNCSYPSHLNLVNNLWPVT